MLRIPAIISRIPTNRALPTPRMYFPLGQLVRYRTSCAIVSPETCMSRTGRSVADGRPPCTCDRTTPRGCRGARYFSRMTAAPEPDVDAGETDLADVKRRTWLAAERTWLAWWRTGLGAAAVSIGVGRLLPGLTGGALWPLRLLGLGYGVVAIAVLVIGAVRQNQVASALRRGSYEELSTPLVLWLTAAAVALSLATLVVIAVA